MRIVMFYHSLLSDWNHGNAHFLRGMVSELQSRGHGVKVFEPADGWSLGNLRAYHGEGPIRRFHAVYGLSSTLYDAASLDLDEALDGADLVIVHEWNDASLVKKIGDRRNASRGFRLFFHDTHHRSVTDPGAISALDLRNYDGVLAYGRVIRDIYLARSWAQRAWTWHEAADTRIFRSLPVRAEETPGDLVWIGNWGDGERSAELMEYFVEPAKSLGLKTSAYGVRYPDFARAALSGAGIYYGGWLPNFDVPEVFARFAVTVHIPRGPYAGILPGIPTIRPFEALACGIPLVCSPWEDSEGLFTPGRDFLVAQGGIGMKRCLGDVLNDRGLARELSTNGLRTILERHTCSHRADELLAIYAGLESGARNAERPETAGVSCQHEESIECPHVSR